MTTDSVGCRTTWNVPSAPVGTVCRVRHLSPSTARHSSVTSVSFVAGRACPITVTAPRGATVVGAACMGFDLAKANALLDEVGLARGGTGVRRLPAGRPLELTPLEFRLLAYLMLHRDRTLPTTELLEHLYGDDASREANAVEALVARRKLSRSEGGQYGRSVRRERGFPPEHPERED